MWTNRNLAKSVTVEDGLGSRYSGGKPASLFCDGADSRRLLQLGNHLTMDLLPTNAAHWHLVVNHLPSSAARRLLAARVGIRQNTDESALTALVLVVPRSIPAFLTGEPAGRFALRTARHQ